MQIGLEIRAESWYNRIANNPSWRFFQRKALADKTAGVFFIFSAILKMAIGEYHKRDCNQSMGVAQTRSWKVEGKGEREYI
nr:MAG TPA: hypothetical protein [Bacteriophage sp.]